ncbi:hypothetical protein [Priestia flexa]|nr:hypothetical protein [Priestia flexa]
MVKQEKLMFGDFIQGDHFELHSYLVYLFQQSQRKIRHIKREAN